MTEMIDAHDKKVELGDSVVFVHANYVEVGKVINMSKSSIHIGFNPYMEPDCSNAHNCLEQCSDPLLCNAEGDFVDIHLCGAKRAIDHAVAMKRTSEMLLVLDPHDSILEATKAKYPLYDEMGKE